MRPLRWALAVFLAVYGVPAAHGQGKAGFKTKFIGENGSYTQPTGGAADGMETISRQQGGHGTFGPVDHAAGKPGRAPAPSQTPSAVEAERSAATAPPAPKTDSPAPGSSNDSAPMEALRDAPSAITGAVPPGARVPGAGASLSDRGRGPARETIKEEPKEKDSKRYSLWNGLAAPLALPGEKVEEVSADEASSLGRQDYASHILGAREVGGAQGPVSSPASAAAPSPGRTFVTIDLQLARAGTPDRPVLPAPGVATDVRGPLDLGAGVPPPSTIGGGLPKTLDAALSGLAARGFEADPRFPPEPRGSDGDRVTVWGWLASDKLGAAILAPGVSKVEVDRSPARPAASRTAETELLLGVRVPAPVSGPGGTAALQKAFADSVKRLESRSGFRWKRTIGYQEAPGGGWVVITQGRVPLRSISEVLSDRDVVKVVPSPDAGSPAGPAPSSVKPVEEFLSFALGRAPLLLGVTLLMLIPSLGGAMLTAVEIFIPYRRV